MKTQNPWMGRVRGSAGNMTGCKVYDKNVLRAKAFEVSNPDTDAQQTQRDFFKEVAAIVATVSEEELRSLFGIKPKAMSRRNALSKQVAAAFSVEDNEKHVDFSKLQAIGNGQKVTTPFMQYIGADDNWAFGCRVEDFKVGNETATFVYVVAFDVTANKIVIACTDYTVAEVTDPITLEYILEAGHVYYGYLTCADRVFEDPSVPFGNFTLKTRSNGKQTPAPPTPETVTISATGYAAWDTFSVDLSGTSAAGGTPTSLVNDGNVVCSGFNEASDDVFTGSFVEAVDASAASTLVVEMPNGSEVTLQVVFAD